MFPDEQLHCIKHIFSQRENGSPNHVPQGLAPLRRKGLSLMQKSLNENFQKTSAKDKLLSKSNISYIIGKLLKCKYQK
jgi:hypothetical protein